MNLNLIGIDLRTQQHDGIRSFGSRKQAEAFLRASGQLGSMHRPAICRAENRFFLFWVVCCTNNAGMLEIATKDGTRLIPHPGYVSGVNRIAFNTSAAAVADMK